MNKRYYLNNAVRGLAAGFLLTVLFALTGVAQDKTPIIIIPGLTGSELVNSKTGERVWFKAPRSKDDDLRLPISTNLAKVRDNLVPGDILRSIKFGIFPRIDVYDGLVQALISKGGFHEENWATPTPQGFENSIYVYPYDWRLDNVENARLLVRKIEQLKVKLNKPGLKFNIIAHSMGGMIARYAAMYGDADLPANGVKAKPTWAGTKLFDKIVLLGTPSEGSVQTLNSLLNGFSIAGININLPWIQNLSKFDLFTMPSGYQLLPAPGTLQAMDENFEPIAIDLYNPKEWSKYGWNAIEDKGFQKQFTAAERRAAPVFFASMLNRAKRLHEALEITNGKNGVPIHIVGATCKDTLDSVVIYRDGKKNVWKALVKPTAFTKHSGVKVAAEDVKKVMLSEGDGVVTKRSMQMVTQSRLAGVDSLLRPASVKYVCEEHNKLAANVEVQDYVIGLLIGVVVPPKVVPTAAVTTIEGTAWQWVSEQTPKENLSVPATEKYSVEFGVDGTLTELTACDRGTGTYKLAGNAITISPLATTQIPCKDASLAKRFGRSLGGAKTFRIEGDALYIETASAGTMKFSKINK